MKEIKPIFSYFGFLSKSVLKRKSIWIVFSIFLISGFVVSLIPSFIGDPSIDVYNFTFSTIEPIAISLTLLPSCFCGVMSFLIPFKDGESDGMELLITSKPITRMQVILSRLIFFSIISIAIGLLTLTFAGITYEVLKSQRYPSSSLPSITFSGFLYDSGMYLGGMFGASILGFLIFGFISAGISLIASGKATRIIAISIVAISSIGSVQMTSLGPIIPSSIQTKITTETLNVLNKYYKNQYVSSLVSSPYKPYERISYFTIENYNITMSINGELGALSLKDAVGFYSENGYHFSADLTMVTPSIWKEISANIGTNITASGVTAVNYLNPLSALSSMVSTNQSFYQSIPYNMSANNVTSLRNGTFIFKVAAADPSWALALMWIGVLIILGSTITYGYLRKDFK